MSLLLARRGSLNPRRAASGGAAEGLITSIPTLTSVTNTLQIGWEFKVGASAITAVGLRVYLPQTITGRTLRLWRVSDQALLASVDVDAVADTWSEGVIADTPLSADTNYVVTVFTGTWYYAGPGGFEFQWASFVQSRSLGGTAFPTSTSASNLYGVTDVVAEGP